MVIERIEKKIEETEAINTIVETAEELGFNVKEFEILKGKEHYRIQKFHKNEHEHGKGGYCLKSVILYKVDNKKENKILDTKDYSRWTTLSDDSEDYPDGKDPALTLYSNDKLAREVFEKLK